VRSAKNVGPGAARNLGMDNSKNDLILYCDSDDYLDDGALVKINDIFQKHRELEILSFNSYILTNIGIYKMALTYDGYPINQILNMDINYNIIKNKNVV
jgi:glycosyltransferase involved in cell wall biosynthesis